MSRKLTERELEDLVIEFLEKMGFKFDRQASSHLAAIESFKAKVREARKGEGK